MALTLLIKYWSQIASGFAGAALAGTLVWTSWRIDSYATAALHAQEMASLEQSLKDQCDQNITKMEAVTNALHKELTASRDRVNMLKLRDAGKKVPVSSSSGGGHGDDGLESTGRDGVTSEALYDFAGRAEECLAKLNACQSWVRSVSK